MDWIPIVFITFKVLVLGAGMFFAIKSHHDLGKKRKKLENHQTARVEVEPSKLG